MQRTFVTHFCFFIISYSFIVRNSAIANIHKKIVCSITINSNNEINAFRKSLSPNQFDFYELTTSESNNWFNSACAMNVRCDVLVLSGHFASQFFGDRGLSLTTLQLEEKSCLKSCTGVTQSPKEVFLFGCNTLADKKPDQRTPEQYMQILINDGFQTATARIIAMARYSPIDHSFRQRMSQVFQSAPLIYGFSAAGPKGIYAAKPVSQFINEIGDYSDHLDRLSSRNQEIIQQEIIKSQKIWKKHFSNYNGTSETNKLESFEESELVCQANNFVRSKKNALVSLEKLLRKQNRLAYLLLAEKLLRNLTYSMLNSDERLAVEQIKSNVELKNEVISGFSHLAYNIDLSLKVIRMMNSLGWLSQEQFQELASKTLGRFLSQPDLKNSDYDAICDSGFWHRYFSYPFTQKQLSQQKLIQVLNCLRVNNPMMISQIQQLYGDPNLPSPVKTEIFVYLYRLGLINN